VQKNIIDAIDHILNHDLVCEHPAAANFVGMVELKKNLMWFFQFLGQILEKQ
jgi:hypothetical protein